MEQKAMDENSQKVEKDQRYIQFDLGNQAYAIHLLSVKEVIPVPQTTSLPNCPSYYVGIMNLRGQIISIIDLRKKLNITKKEELTDEAVIIVDINGASLGVIVDSINKVLNVSGQEVTEVPEVSAEVNAKYIEGVFKDEDSLTVFLDLESVFNVKEIQRLQSKAA